MALNNSDLRMKQEDPAEKEVRDTMLQLERQKKRKKLDDQIKTLAERAIAFEDQYGFEDDRTQIMVMFLDVTLEMKSAIDLLSDVGIALQCIGQAIGCLDDVLSMQEEMLDGTLEHKYGFWERLRRKRKLRRAMRNNAARMQQMCDMLVGSQQMALSMVAALRKSAAKMKAATSKNFAKQKKQEEKRRAANPQEQPQESLAKKLMDQMRGNSGNGGGTGAGGNSGNGGTTGTPANKGFYSSASTGTGSGSGTGTGAGDSDINDII